MLLCLVLTACWHDTGRSVAESEAFETKYAVLLPQHMPPPSQRCAVDASVYAELMKMLGVGDRCIDFSSTTTLDVELLAVAHPDALLLSTYDGVDVAKFKRLGIPVVECRDFLEPTALGRAEWMRFFGRMWGVGERADSLFAEVERSYQANCCERPTADEESRPTRPTVFFDLPFFGSWYQPTRKSTTGRMVVDAGGRMAVAIGEEGGGRPLSKEQALMGGSEADVWIIRYTQPQPLTRADLLRRDASYARFRAIQTDRVYGCNTLPTRYFEETAFRPDWLLSDFRKILEGNDSLKYFHKIQ